MLIIVNSQLVRQAPHGMDPAPDAPRPRSDSRGRVGSQGRHLEPGYNSRSISRFILAVHILLTVGQIWELAEGRVLFNSTWTADGKYSSDAHLAQMIALFGRFPESLLNGAADRERFFDTQDKYVVGLYSTANLLTPPRQASSTVTVLTSQLGTNMSECGSYRCWQEKFLDFIQSMVKLDPKKRPDAKELLKSAWLA